MSDGLGDPGPAIGSEFAGHRVEGLVGRGGMGIVYRARNLALDRVRALKVLSPTLSADDRFRERFRRESRLAASIEHPNLLPVHQAGEEDGHLYLAMRLVEGRDLRELIVNDGPLEPVRAAEIVRGVASGLDAAHGAELVHRDVKPANVLVGDGADSGRIYLTDFGISRTMRGGETVTGTGELVGTADFVAPEQITGDPVDHRADVYALGAVIHFTLTGRAPFPRENELATLFAHANAPRPRPTEENPALPAAIDAVVAKAMAIAPADRYASAGDLARALEEALADDTRRPGGAADASEPDQAETRPLARPPGKGARRGRRLAYAAAGLIALAVAALLVVAALRSDEVRAPAVTASQPIEIGDGPTGIAVGPSRVWVAAQAGDRVDGVDLISGALAFKVPVAAPHAAAVGHNSVWTVSKQTDSAYRLDPLEDKPPLRIQLPVGADPIDVAVDEDWVWVANAGSENLLRLDPQTDEIAGNVSLGTEPRSIATGGGEVWVTNIRDDSVSRVTADPPRRTGVPIAVDELPNDVVVGEGAVWVTSNLKGTVTRIDPLSGLVAGDPVQVGSLPRGVAAGLGYVWVALGGEDSAVRLDPESGELVGEPIPVGDDPSELAVGEDSVWVASEGDSTITRLDP